MKSIITSYAQFSIRHADDGYVYTHHSVSHYGNYILKRILNNKNRKEENGKRENNK